MQAAHKHAYEHRHWAGADGLKLFARDYAATGGRTRRPVVCLHGLTRSSHDFGDVAPVIAETGRRVIVPDIRGRGLSGYDPDPMNYVPSVYASDVIALLKNLGIEVAVFVGTSLGGVITMIVAGMPDNPLAAAILNDVGPEVDPAGLARIVASTASPRDARNWDDALQYVRVQNGVAFPKYNDSDWLEVAHRVFRDDGAGHLVPDYDEAISVPIEAGRLVVPPEIVWRLFSHLANTYPTLLIRGALSDILSATVTAKMRARAPSLKYAEIDDVGHAPVLTEPQSRNAILNFLDGLP